MSRLPAEFREDLALKKAARTVLLADWKHAQENLNSKAIAGRVTGRMASGAKDVLEVARVQADDHRGILAMLIGAVILFFSKDTLLEIFAGNQSAEAETEPDTASDTASDTSGDSDVDETEEPAEEDSADDDVAKHTDESAASEQDK